MKISSITIPENIYDDGLHPVSLKGLGNTVLLAGRNGAGKTRLLNAIVLSILAKKIHNEKRGVRQNLTADYFSKQLDTLELEVHNTAGKKKDATISQIGIYKYASFLESHFLEDSEFQDSTPPIRLENCQDEQKIQAVNFVPKELSWIDNREISQSDCDDYLSHVRIAGADNVELGICAVIRNVTDRYITARGNAVEGQTNDSKERAIKKFEDLNELMQSLLGESLKLNESGRPTIRGKHILDANLSEGQKVLVQLAVQLHEQVDKLDSVILLLDEPENHLHPQACIDLIEKIRSSLPKNQIWIATHSTPIISYFFRDATLLFVEDGKVAFSGSTPDRVFKSLLGDQDRIQRLRDFLGLPSEYAMLNYAAECLSPPGVHGDAENDPQVEQIRNQLATGREVTKPSRVLDYGAGKGRLLKELFSGDDIAPGQIDYVAYDKYPEDKLECMESIHLIYGENKTRYFNSLNDIGAHFDQGSFNTVLMCNVFHEISPTEWCSIFSQTGPLMTLLDTEGHLLLVEDEEIPVGEKAYREGFIVFNTPELRTLFDIPEAAKGFISSDFRKDGRLMAHLISKKHLNNISTDSIVRALTLKRNKSKEEIVRLRDGEPNFKNGRKHAFWVQQYTNTSLVLEGFS